MILGWWTNSHYSFLEVNTVLLSHFAIDCPVREAKRGSPHLLPINDRTRSRQSSQKTLFKII